MFCKLPLARLGSVLALSLGAMFASAPSALAACACMCVDGSPFNVCTGFVNTQEQTPECDALACPAVDEPAPDPVTTTPDPVEDPVAVIDPPHPGLVCERRAVYRPDLGKYKKYKVCKPSADERHRRRHGKKHGHAKHADAWASRNDRMKAKWEARMAKHRHRHGGHDDDEGDS